MKYKLIFLLTLSIFFNQLPAQEFSKTKYFKKAYIEKAIKKAASWQLANPKYELYSWTNGVLYAGIFSAYETTGSKKLYRAMEDMGNAINWKPGPRLFHADDYAICQTYVDLYWITKDRKMIEPTLMKLDTFMTTPYTTWPSQAKIRANDMTIWWWCDALFMAPPLLVKLGISLKEDKYLELNDKLFKDTYNQLYDKEEHLYARDLRFKWGEEGIEKVEEANGKKIFWSRGNGWVMGGLVRILDELPENYPNRNFYVKNFKEMADKIASIQQEDGLWRASLLDPDSYPGGEASGSGLYCYAFAWGINNGILDKDKFLPVVEKAWIGLTSLRKKNGMVGWVQPVGADPRANFSAESWEVYGTGAFLLAGSEVIKLNNSIK